MRYPDGGALTTEERGRRRWSRRGYLQERQPAPDYRSLDTLSVSGLLGWPGGPSPRYRQPEPAAGGRHCTEAAAQLASSSSAAVRPASAVRRRKPAMSSSSSS